MCSLEGFQQSQNDAMPQPTSNEAIVGLLAELLALKTENDRLIIEYSCVKASNQQLQMEYDKLKAETEQLQLELNRLFS
jgi:FtsZ-binding cell division protein ZapB